jgi:hypothetical protein
MHVQIRHGNMLVKFEFGPFPMILAELKAQVSYSGRPSVCL